MTGWKSSLWKSPFVELSSQPDRVKLTMPMLALYLKDVLKELNNRFDNLDRLTSDELTILSFALMEGSISNQRLQYVLNIHSADISIMLRKLCDTNFLVSDNNGRWTTYRLASKVATPGPKVATPGPKVATPGPKVAIPGPKVATPGPKVATSDPKVATSGPKVATSAIEIPKKLKREELDTLILEFCKNRYVKKGRNSCLYAKSRKLY